VTLGERVRLIGGARYERDDLTVNAQSTLGQPISTSNLWTDVLPSLAMNYRPTTTQAIRLSVARTLARPEYRELSPIKSRDVLNGDDLEGNASLERTRIDNADLRWEWYPNAGEILSIGIFTKRFDQPIERVYRAAGSGTRTVTFINADRADNYGVELELRKGLGAVAQRLAPFSVFTNLTLMRSRIHLGETTASATNPDRSMVGQAPFVFNSGITYTSESGSTSATLLFNRVGERIDAAGDSPLPDVIERPRSVLDLSLRFPLFSSVSGRFDARNLFDAPYEMVQGTVTRESYRAGRVFQAGLIWRP
jgi:TonB-dependent receptor